MMPIKQLIFEGVEADDLIALCVNLPIYKGWQKLILSNDKDFYQLLNEETVIYRPTVKRYMTITNVLNEFHIHPTNFTLARAIAGDASDNLPGAPGVGLKTVVKYFPQVSSSVPATLPSIFDACKKTESKIKAYKSILDSKSKVELNYKMMQLYAPIVSPTVKRVTRNILKPTELTFNMTAMRTQMTIDGFGAYSWWILESSMKRLVRESKNT